MSDNDSVRERGIRGPLIGFAAAAVLTIIPFVFVVTRPFTFAWTLVIIAVCAVAQILVHMRYFLHVDLSPSARDRLVALAFAGTILFLMTGGTIWIILDLHARMVF